MPPAGPRSHPPAKPERRDHARHRRPGAQCSATHPGRHHRGRAPGRVWPLLRRQPGMACSFSGTGPGGLHLARFARARLRGLISEAAMAAMLAESCAWAWPILLACADARAPHRQALVPLARVPPLRLVTAAGTGTNSACRPRGPGRGPARRVIPARHPPGRVCRSASAPGRAARGPHSSASPPPGRRIRGAHRTPSAAVHARILHELLERRNAFEEVELAGHGGVDGHGSVLSPVRRVLVMCFVAAEQPDIPCPERDHLTGWMALAAEYVSHRAGRRSRRLIPAPVMQDV